MTESIEQNEVHYYKDKLNLESFFLFRLKPTIIQKTDQYR